MCLSVFLLFALFLLDNVVFVDALALLLAPLLPLRTVLAPAQNHELTLLAAVALPVLMWEGQFFWTLMDTAHIDLKFGFFAPTALLVVEVFQFVAVVAFSLGEDVASGAEIAASVILELFSSALIALVVVPELTFWALMTTVVVVVFSFGAFVALVVIFVLLINGALVALAIILVLILGTFVAASFIEVFLLLALVTLSLILDFSLGTFMADAVVIVESLLAIVASSIVVNRRFFAALDSALSFNVLLSAGATFTPALNFVLLVRRAFSAFVVVVVGKVLGTAAGANLNFAFGTFIALLVVVDFSVFALTALSL